MDFTLTLLRDELYCFTMSDVRDQDLKNTPGVSAENVKPTLSAVIMVIVIVGVLIIAALYMWGERISDERESSGYPVEAETSPQTYVLP